MIGLSGLLSAIPTIVSIAGAAKEVIPVVFKAKDLVEDATTEFTKLLDRDEITEETELTTLEAELVESEDIDTDLRKLLMKLPPAFAKNLNDGSKKSNKTALQVAKYLEYMTKLAYWVAGNSEKIDKAIPDQTED